MAPSNFNFKNSFESDNYTNSNSKKDNYSTLVDNKIVFSGMFCTFFLSLNPEEKHEIIKSITKINYNHIKLHYIKHDSLAKEIVHKYHKFVLPFSQTNKDYPKKGEVHIYLKFRKN